MRGKEKGRRTHKVKSGITPAYAGKSGPCPDRVPPAGDHPRVCGEKACCFLVFASLMGSPPRMRGKVDFCRQLFTGDGITPAYAGKSRFLPTAFHRGRDHPRVCGEKSYANRTQMGHIGSPPRMRGKEYIFLYVFHNIGITPAYAGKSTRPFSSGHENGDHPRVCGEKTYIFQDFRGWKGSPPRMRGKD